MDEKDVEKLAHLSRLQLQGSEAEALRKRVSSIIEYVKTLDTIDTSDVEPMSHVHGISNVFRDDTVKPSLDVQEILGIAPDASGRFIRVPIIIEQES